MFRKRQIWKYHQWLDRSWKSTNSEFISSSAIAWGIYSDMIIDIFIVGKFDLVWLYMYVCMYICIYIYIHTYILASVFVMGNITMPYKHRSCFKHAYNYYFRPNKWHIAGIRGQLILGCLHDDGRQAIINWKEYCAHEQSVYAIMFCIIFCVFMFIVGICIYLYVGAIVSRYYSAAYIYLHNVFQPFFQILVLVLIKSHIVTLIEIIV